MKKRKPKETKRRLNLPLSILVGLACLVFTWIVILPFAMGSLYISSRQKSESEIENGLSAALLGAVIYKIKDLNCSSTSSVGLQTRITCSMAGYKVTLSNGDFAPYFSLGSRIAVEQVAHLEAAEIMTTARAMGFESVAVTSLKEKYYEKEYWRR